MSDTLVTADNLSDEQTWRERAAPVCTCPPMWPLEHVGKHYPTCPLRVHTKAVR